MTGRDLFKIIKCFLWLRYLLYPVFLLHNILSTVYKKVKMLYRFFYYKSCCKSVGMNVSVHDNVYLFYPENLSLGNNVSIHPLCYIDAEGGISIGNNVSIAHNVTIMSSNHKWDNESVPIKYCSKERKKTIIDDDVWIAAGCRIMAGVKIGKRVVVAAGAVVTKDCEPNSLYAGVPAKKIRSI